MLTRYSLLFVVLLLSILTISCNTDTTIIVPSSTSMYSPSDSAITYFLSDATDFAVEHLYEINSPDTTSVMLPDSVLNQYLYPLARLFDGRSEYPVLDTLISQRILHRNMTWSGQNIVLADTSQVWVQNVENHTFPTGNNMVDSLIVLFDLDIEVSSGGGTGAQEWLVISHPPINSYALARTFLQVPGVTDARASFVLYASSYLQVSHYSEATLVQFGFTDGSLHSRQWIFSIDHNYHIEYLGFIDH